MSTSEMELNSWLNECEYGRMTAKQAFDGRALDTTQPFFHANPHPQEEVVYKGKDGLFYRGLFCGDDKGRYKIAYGGRSKVKYTKVDPGDVYAYRKEEEGGHEEEHEGGHEEYEVGHEEDYGGHEEVSEPLDGTLYAQLEGVMSSSVALTKAGPVFAMLAGLGYSVLSDLTSLSLDAWEKLFDDEYKHPPSSLLAHSWAKDVYRAVNGLSSTAKYKKVCVRNPQYRGSYADATTLMHLLVFRHLVSVPSSVIWRELDHEEYLSELNSRLEPYFTIDFSAYPKGWYVDCARKHLRKIGVIDGDGYFAGTSVSEKSRGEDILAVLDHEIEVLEERLQ